MTAEKDKGGDGILKKIKLAFALILLLISICISASAESPLAKYTAAFDKAQGQNSWYFMKFGSEITELEWNDAGYWGTSPYLCGWEVNTGADGSGVGYKFIIPAGGRVRLRGKVEQINPDCAKGDGVTAGIYYNDNELWKSGVIKYGVSNAEYDINIDVAKGEALYFRTDPRSNNYFDWTAWFPTVEYTDINFDDLCTYHQKKGDEIKEIVGIGGEYIADDKKAFVSKERVMPSAEYSLIKRFVVPADGRFRILADIDTSGIFVGSTVAAVWQNGKNIWEQRFADDAAGVLDVRVFGRTGDVLDVEISAENPKSDKHISWSCNFEKYVGTIPCISTDSCGSSRNIAKETALSSVFADRQGKGGAKFYSIKNDLKYPMTFNSNYYRWEQNIPSRSFVEPILVYDETKGYVSEAKASPGYLSESVIEYTVSQEGFLWLNGDIDTGGSGDGVVAKIDINGKRLWSNRVGGERSVRWDEPYDVSFFLNKINAVTYVKSGDKISFLFNRWRKPGAEAVNLSKIKMSYINGGVLSDTTKWKLKKSIVIDTKNKNFYKNGVKSALDMYITGGAVYVSGAALNEILKEQSSESEKYYSIREKAENSGYNVLWAADRFVIIYLGIPLRFGYAEMSEIETYTKYCERPVVSVKTVDESGGVTEKFVSGKRYFSEISGENRTENSVDIQALVCLYEGDRLYKTIISDKTEILPGASVTSDNTALGKIEFIPDDNVTAIKIFVWSGIQNAVPMCKAVSLTREAAN